MRPVILTIDDDKITHHFVSKALEQNFRLESAMNGVDGLSLVRSLKPDAILLDVEMPSMTGYQVCDEIKQDREISDIPVVFLTTHSTLPERMRSYEVGGTDYIVKPFDPDTLRAKLDVLLEHHKLEAILRKTALNTQDSAILALTSTSDFGQLIQFVESVASIVSIDALVMKIIQACNNLDLNIVLLLDTPEGEQWFSPWQSVSPLEKQVVQMLRVEEQIHNFGPRTVINYPLVSLMIKNMPLKDAERCDRVKQIVSAILTTANSKVEAMNSINALKQQSADLTQTVAKVKQSLSGLVEASHGCQMEVDRTLRMMFTELQTRLTYMALEESQELYIVDHIDHGILSVRDIEDQSLPIFDSVTDTLQDLEDLVSRTQQQDHNLSSAADASNEDV